MTQSSQRLPTGSLTSERARSGEASGRATGQGCVTCNDAGVRVQDFDAAIFDLDGVVTRTARVHAAAWKRLFDEYLHQRAAKTGEPFRPFDIERDYRSYVDGKPRYDGVASFLESRGIALPRGDSSDPPDRETVCGLGNRKDQYFHEILQNDGVEVFDSTVLLIRRLRSRHIRTAHTHQRISEAKCLLVGE